MRLIDADKIYEILGDKSSYGYVSAFDISSIEIVKAIPIQQLLNILSKYDDYIHTKTYPHNETMEDIYSKGYEDGWNACLKAIKEELDYWEKEHEERTNA